MTSPPPTIWPPPLYLHGLEGSPKGTKGAWMTARFGAVAPEMPARAGVENAFARCVDVARMAVEKHAPSLIVGSSYGGAVLMQLIVDGVWKGPSIFLAQAAVKLGVGDRLPPGIPAIFIHAPGDAVVPYEDSVTVVTNSDEQAVLWTVEGDHRLHFITEDGTLENAILTLLNPSQRDS